MAFATTSAHAGVVFTDTTPGNTTFVVPVSGTYDIYDGGAAGGTNNYYKTGAGGAEMGGAIFLSQGEILKITVGAIGSSGGGRAASGGGGSFVGSGGKALVVAGGGGGPPGITITGGSGGLTTTSGGAGTNGGGGGGFSGGGGGSGRQSTRAGGGGGGSYLTASATLLKDVAATNTGAGYVTITEISAVPEPASLALLSLGLGGTMAARRRRAG